MQLRRFNRKGIDAFTMYLDALRLDPSRPVPTELLTNDALVSPLAPPIQTPAPPVKGFASRMAFASWLHDAATASGAQVPRKDAGFWSWLTLALFDQVCPADAKGQRKVGELARYLPQFDNYLRRYRHLLATPYEVLLMHEDDPTCVAIILHSPLNVLGELTEQFASRQELISCKGTMALASHLFFDSKGNKTKNRASGNAARRFGKLLNQYQRTWDITVMTPKQSSAILPKDFDKFKSDEASDAVV